MWKAYYFIYQAFILRGRFETEVGFKTFQDIWILQTLTLLHKNDNIFKFCRMILITNVLIILVNLGSNDYLSIKIRDWDYFLQNWGTFYQCTQLYQNPPFPANMRQIQAFFATVQCAMWQRYLKCCFCSLELYFHGVMIFRIFGWRLGSFWSTKTKAVKMPVFISHTTKHDQIFELAKVRVNLKRKLIFCSHFETISWLSLLLT